MRESAKILFSISVTIAFIAAIGYAFCQFTIAQITKELKESLGNGIENETVNIENGTADMDKLSKEAESLETLSKTSPRLILLFMSSLIVAVIALYYIFSDNCDSQKIEKKRKTAEKDTVNKQRAPPRIQ